MQVNTINLCYVMEHIEKININIILKQNKQSNYGTIEHKNR